MSGKMTIRGIGHMFEYFVFPFGVITIVISFIFKPFFSLNFIPYILLLIAGISFIIIGVAINILSMTKIVKAFSKGQLVTTGPFKYSRNPTYFAVIFFVIPGICFLFNSWLSLSTVVFAYILFRLLIKKEEIFLQEKYGDEYINYKKKTGLLFPRFF